MNKGFSLIEVIVYTGLLSMLIVGVFSSVLSFVYMSVEKETVKDEDYELLIENYHE